MESNGGSLKNVAEIFVLFLCGVQLVLRSGVLTIILDLDEVDATPSLLRSLGRCCLGLVALLVAGSAAGVLTVSLNRPLPQTTLVEKTTLHINQDKKPYNTYNTGKSQ